MIIVKEDAYDNITVFKDECTANPTWQMVNRVCNEYGYNFNPYACIRIDKNGKAVLDDITVFTKDPQLPKIEITIDKDDTFHYTIHNELGYVDFTVGEYEKYIKKLQGVPNLIAELSGIDFYGLYVYHENGFSEE